MAFARRSIEAGAGTGAKTSISEPKGKTQVHIPKIDFNNAGVDDDLEIGSDSDQLSGFDSESESEPLMCSQSLPMQEHQHYAEKGKGNAKKKKKTQTETETTPINKSAKPLPQKEDKDKDKQPPACATKIWIIASFVAVFVVIGVVIGAILLMKGCNTSGTNDSAVDNDIAVENGNKPADNINTSTSSGDVGQNQIDNPSSTKGEAIDGSPTGGSQTASASLKSGEVLKKKGSGLQGQKDDAQQSFTPEEIEHKGNAQKWPDVKTKKPIKQPVQKKKNEKKQPQPATVGVEKPKAEVKVVNPGKPPVSTDKKPKIEQSTGESNSETGNGSNTVVKEVVSKKLKKDAKNTPVSGSTPVISHPQGQTKSQSQATPQTNKAKEQKSDLLDKLLSEIKEAVNKSNSNQELMFQNGSGITSEQNLKDSVKNVIDSVRIKFNVRLEEILEKVNEKSPEVKQAKLQAYFLLDYLKINEILKILDSAIQKFTEKQTQKQQQNELKSKIRDLFHKVDTMYNVANAYEDDDDDDPDEKPLDEDLVSRYWSFMKSLDGKNYNTEIDQLPHFILFLDMSLKISTLGMKEVKSRIKNFKLDSQSKPQEYDNSDEISEKSLFNEQGYQMKVEQMDEKTYIMNKLQFIFVTTLLNTAEIKFLKEKKSSAYKHFTIAKEELVTAADEKSKELQKQMAKDKKNEFMDKWDEDQNSWINRFIEELKDFARKQEEVTPKGTTQSSKK